MTRFWLIFWSYTLVLVAVVNALSYISEPVKKARLGSKNIFSSSHNTPLKTGASHDDDDYFSQLESWANAPKCMCSMIYDPVCSSNNKTYYNPCLMDCEAKEAHQSVYIVHQGNCIYYRKSI